MDTLNQQQESFSPGKSPHSNISIDQVKRLLIRSEKLINDLLLAPASIKYDELKCKKTESFLKECHNQFSKIPTDKGEEWEWCRDKLDELEHYMSKIIRQHLPGSSPSRVAGNYENFSIPSADLSFSRSSGPVAATAAASTSTNNRELIVEEIIKQVRQLRANNLAIKGITEKDLNVLDDTAEHVETHVKNMKIHNKNMSIFNQASWKTSSIYWLILFITLVVFVIAYLTIRIFPRFS